MTEITDALRITGRTLALDDVDPASTPGFTGDKAAGVAALEAGGDQLAGLQERLYADSRVGGNRSVLLIVQGMDTSGKGGIMRHVVGQIDPQGVRITAFKAPTAAEKRHDFLWRIDRAVPTPGLIGVFDRSQYEDVLIHRVRGLSTPEVVQERYGKIVEFEQGLAERGVEVVKVMLHISKDEQGARLLERLDRDDKHWKFNPSDIDERGYWDDYMRAYQVAINRTARADAPWFVVPANRKWFARLAVQQILTEALERINPQWPVASFDVAAERDRLIAAGDIDPTALAASESAGQAKADAAVDERRAAKRAKADEKAQRATEVDESAAADVDVTVPDSASSDVVDANDAKPAKDKQSKDKKSKKAKKSKDDKKSKKSKDAKSKDRKKKKG